MLPITVCWGAYREFWAPCQVGQNEDLSRNPKPLASYWLVLNLSSGLTLLFCTWGSSPVHKGSWVWSGVPNSRVLQHSAAPQWADDGQGQGRLSPGQVDCVEWKTTRRTHRKTRLYSHKSEDWLSYLTASEIDRHSMYHVFTTMVVVFFSFP